MIEGWVNLDWVRVLVWRYDDVKALSLYIVLLLVYSVIE